MKPTIQAYQYVFIRKEVEQLLNTYSSVNDQKTVKTVQAFAEERISQLFPENPFEITAFLKEILDIRLTKAKAEKALLDLKVFIEPFQQPEKAQLEKVFKKVKKLPLPEWGALDLYEHTYVGWNDPASQRKYLTFYQDGKLTGISGRLSPNVSKGICSICQKTSSVALFLATTKASSDGTYTKKGNYICQDSSSCNHQLSDYQQFQDFIQLVRFQDKK
ncbi:hypothetical protein M2139_000345 [Enterococcus sp. PF1-24]|uniref:FusB/FusC family EF-G-binding protein n=1 Tax=unclassified Enterococcus TaxID=2608891 RepID=UPI002476154C|nr:MULTISPECIES: FusB/FusC family EF-G-binding protein [unclassified Enterococcus]MDH6363235.1 hypothetical protein [Enterococcus sp. PFB1-1]MDH6400464.1 hypothetical protein [Enterococcus sp. PF1-24]